METVIRTFVMYVILFVIFRLAGKRSLAHITTFDFILLLIIGDAVQQGLAGEDYSLIGSILVIATLFTIDIGLTKLKNKIPHQLEEFLDDIPLVIVEDGHMLKDRMQRAHVNENDILAAARENQVEDLDEIKYGVLERSGEISIIPRKKKN